MVLGVGVYITGKDLTNYCQLIKKLPTYYQVMVVFVDNTGPTSQLSNLGAPTARINNFRKFQGILDVLLLTESISTSTQPSSTSTELVQQALHLSIHVMETVPHPLVNNYQMVNSYQMVNKGKTVWMMVSQIDLQNLTDFYHLILGGRHRSLVVRPLQLMSNL